MKRRKSVGETRKRNRSKNGFTLVELIVVLVILSVLAAVAVPSLLGFIDDSKAKECRTQVEALAAEVSTAKMAAEVDGEEGGKPFDVGAYIESAGEKGKCPVDGRLYAVVGSEIRCLSNHGTAKIQNSGTFSVAVATPEPEVIPTIPTEKMTEAPPETPDTDENEGSAPEPNVSLKVDPGSIDNLEIGESQEVTASVTIEGLEGKDNVQYTYTWESPEPSSVTVTPMGNGSSANVTGKSAGKGTVTCTVTVTYTENGETKTITDTREITVTVTEPETEPKTESEIEPKPEPSIAVEVTPDHIGDLKKGESTEIKANVTTQGLEGKENVEYKYEWRTSDPSVTVTPTGNGSSANVTGESAGTSTVTCTVTVTYTENGETKTVTDTKDIPVTVTHTYTARIVPTEGASLKDMNVNDSVELTVEVTDETGTRVDPSKVTVEWIYPEDGSVSGPQNGTNVSAKAEHAGDGQIQCKVTVKEDGGEESKTAECKPVDVIVKESEPERQLQLDGPDNLSVEVGEHSELNVTAKYDDGTPYDGTLSYNSSNTDVVTVDPDGKIHGVAPGTCKVTVTVVDDKGNNVTKEIEITVTEVEQETQTTSSQEDTTFEANLRNAFVNLNDSDKDVNGKELIFTVTLSGDTSGKWVEWSVEPEGILEMREYDKHVETGYNGKCGFVAKNDGICTVTAKVRGMENATASCEITVYRQIDNLGLSGEQQLYAGDQEQYIPVFAPENATYKDVTYSSDNPDAASIDANGLVTAHKVDTAQYFNLHVYAPAVGNTPAREGVLNIQVQPLLPTKVRVEPEIVKLYLNQDGDDSQKVNVIVDEPKSEYVSTNVTWNSYNTSIATVDADGVITAVGKGECEVHASVMTKDEAKDHKIQVIVEEAPPQTQEEPGEVSVDGQRFKATSWEEFQAAVVANPDYEINRNKDGSKKDVERDSPIYYQDYEDENGNIVRHYYVALGTAKNYKEDAKRADVAESDSFDAFMKKRSTEFAEILPIPINIADTLDWSELAGKTEKYAAGTVVKVIKDGKVEYYIANSQSGAKMELCDIAESDPKENGWWRLDVLP